MASTPISSEDEFHQNVTNSEKPLIVVHFWAEWAPQCIQMEDVVQELKKDSEYKNVLFFKVEAESLPNVSQKFNISSVPTFLFFSKKKMVDRLEGANAPELSKKTKQLLSKALIIPTAEHPTEDLNSSLKQLINKAPCMLFMKGTPEEPKCGFSKQTIELLKKHNAEYTTFNILTNEEIRQGLKRYSNWPTYPQLYINGELVGGLDILKELSENGELETMLPKTESLNTRLEKLINKAPVMVFMKGSPDTPRCGFSKTLTTILKETGVVYESFDILQDEEVRQGMKTYSNWPTYPQVYVKGNLIGGLDIIKEMHESGDLKEALLVQ